jgi:two-component system, chemotaxis family, response regulator Rcp1
LITEAIKKSTIIRKCHVVNDGEQALDFLNRSNGFSAAPTPDVILLDLNLPRKHGFEVLSELKNHPTLQKIPVVVITCSHNEADIKKSYELYANCYVVKPTEFDEFEEIVRTIESFWGRVASLPSVN